MGLDCYLHPRDLYAFLSVTFSCVVVDDELTRHQPFCEFNDGRAKNLGTIPNVLERLHSAVEISAQQRTPCMSQYNILRFNQIDFRQGDILDLFGISGIALPTEYQFPTKFYMDYHEVQQEYAMCLIFMQKQFQNVSCIHQSFYEFAQQTTRIVNCINHALSQQFELINYIYLLYHFVDTLASPSQQKVRQIDSLSYDIDQLKGIVLKTHWNSIPE